MHWALIEKIITCTKTSRTSQKWSLLDFRPLIRHSEHISAFTYICPIYKSKDELEHNYSTRISYKTVFLLSYTHLFCQLRFPIKFYFNGFKLLSFSISLRNNYPISSSFSFVHNINLTSFFISEAIKVMINIF